MSDAIIQTITDNEVSISNLHQQYGANRLQRDEEIDSPLEAAQHHLLEILAITGPKIFDDIAQWKMYQNIIAALLLIDRELRNGGSQSLAEHAIAKPAPGNYNPLGELEKLDEPTIKQLGERYGATEAIDSGLEDQPPMLVQKPLSGALLELTAEHVPSMGGVEQHLLTAMREVDDHYGVETRVEVTEVMETIGSGDDQTEYSVPQIGIRQSQQTDQSPRTSA